MLPLSRCAGFTFVELIVVVMLLALLSTLLIPGIPDTLPFQIRSASRVVAADLQYASQRSIATGRPHFWVVDLDAQAFRIEMEYTLEPEASDDPVSHAGLLDLSPPKPTTEIEPVENKSGEWRFLDEPDVSVARVAVGESEHDDGVTRIAFAPDGGADPAEIWLEDTDGRQTRLDVFAFTGEIRIVEDPEDE